MGRTARSIAIYGIAILSVAAVIIATELSRVRLGVVAPAVWPRLTPQQLGERTGQGQDRMDQSGRDLA